MRKLFALILGLALAVSCAVTGFAETAERPPLEVAEMGLKLKEPAALTNQEGYGFFSEPTIISHDPYFSILSVNHLAFSAKRVIEIQHGDVEATDADLAGFSRLQYPLMLVFVTTAPERTQSLVSDPEELKPVEFARKDSFHYYYLPLPDSELEGLYADLAVQYPEAYPAEALDKWKTEAEKMRQATAEALSAAETFAPVDPAASLIGQTLQFETTDLDGNAVKSQELFGQNRMTMINVWGTWCPNCVNEMKELGDIHRKLQEQGCGILGLEYEGGPIGAETRESARKLLSDNGCDYPNVVIPEGNDLLDSIIEGYPTTIFVDSEGKILTFPIVGADVKLYEETIGKLLSAEQTAKDEVPAVSANDAQAYRVFVFADSKPVEGVMIQFCSAEACFVGKTDAAGMAAFQQPEGEYEIHVLKAPEGYAPAQTTYKTLASYCDVNIALEPIK